MDIVVFSKAEANFKQKFKLSSKNLITLGFKLQSIQQNHEFQTMEQRNGQYDFGTYDVKRKIEVPIFFNGYSSERFSLIRDEIFGLFNNKSSVFIGESDDQGFLITGKVYEVKLIDVIDIERLGTSGKAALIFETTNSPYGHSIQSTQTIKSSGFLNNGTWAFGMGLETVDDSELNYTHKALKGQTFKIFNAGNTDIRPFESYLEVTLSKIANSSDTVRLKNKTTGTWITLKIKSATSDIWVYDGPNITKNSLAAAKYTDKSFLRIVPGWNIFELTGADSADISFDFNYLYR